MTHKYFAYTLQGEHTAHSARHALGAALADALIVRTHTHGGKTTVYVAGHAEAVPAASGAHAPREVSEADVLKLS